jgi:hypothetical protein
LRGFFEQEVTVLFTTGEKKCSFQLLAVSFYCAGSGHLADS